MTRLLGAFAFLAIVALVTWVLLASAFDLRLP